MNSRDAHFTTVSAYNLLKALAEHDAYEHTYFPVNMEKALNVNIVKCKVRGITKWSVI